MACLPVIKEYTNKIDKERESFMAHPAVYRIKAEGFDENCFIVPQPIDSKPLPLALGRCLISIGLRPYQGTYPIQEADQAQEEFWNAVNAGLSHNLRKVAPVEWIKNANLKNLTNYIIFNRLKQEMEEREISLALLPESQEFFGNGRNQDEDKSKPGLLGIIKAYFGSAYVLTVKRMIQLLIYHKDDSSVDELEIMKLPVVDLTKITQLGKRKITTTTSVMRGRREILETKTSYLGPMREVGSLWALENEMHILKQIRKLYWRSEFSDDRLIEKLFSVGYEGTRNWAIGVYGHRWKFSNLLRGYKAERQVLFRQTFAIDPKTVVTRDHVVKAYKDKSKDLDKYISSILDLMCRHFKRDLESIFTSCKTTVQAQHALLKQELIDRSRSDGLSVPLTKFNFKVPFNEILKMRNDIEELLIRIPFEIIRAQNSFANVGVKKKLTNRDNKILTKELENLRLDIESLKQAVIQYGSYKDAIDLFSATTLLLTGPPFIVAKRLVEGKDPASSFFGMRYPEMTKSNDSRKCCNWIFTCAWKGLKFNEDSLREALKPT